MRNNLFAATLLCFSFLTHAQESTTSSRSSYQLPEKYLKLEFSTGANFDLMNRGNSGEYDLISTKPGTVPTFGIKLTHLFARKWGWYTQFQFNFYHTKRAEGLWSETVEDFFEGFGKALFAPVFLVRPSVDAGLVYRIETARWRVHPQVGIGWLSYLESQNKEKTRTKNQEKRTVKYKQSANPMVVNMGLSLNYFFNNRIYLLLNANFQQPIQRSWARMTYFVDDIKSEEITQRSGTAGQNINLHAGFGFCPWIKPKRQSSRYY